MFRAAALMVLAAAVLPPAGSVFAQTVAPASAAGANITYADLVDLADSAPLVIRAQVRKQAGIESAGARAVKQGFARVYVEAKTEALLSGQGVVGDTLHFLADVPLDGRGKPTALKRKSILIFARAVPNRPGELQLVAPNGYLPWDPSVETRLRGVLTELLAPDAPGKVNGVREALYVPGNLAGSGETQFFLSTPDGSPAAITVNHRPGAGPEFGVSFSELLGGGQIPARDTLGWYRLACFLPKTLPQSAQISAEAGDQQQAAADYALFMGQIGTCPRRH